MSNNKIYQVSLFISQCNYKVIGYEFNKSIEEIKLLYNDHMHINIDEINETYYNNLKTEALRVANLFNKL